MEVILHLEKLYIYFLKINKMDIDTIKKEIIKKVEGTFDENLLEELDFLLSEINEKLPISNGKKVFYTKNELTDHIEKISKSVNEGAKTFTSNEVRNYILGN